MYLFQAIGARSAYSIMDTDFCRLLLFHEFIFILHIIFILNRYLHFKFKLQQLI